MSRADAPRPGTLRVHAPFAGRVLASADLPDPVFAQQMMGEGLGLEPRTGADGAAVEVLAPVAGRLTSQWHHAAIVEPAGAPAGTGVLTHLGLNTVTLQGEGFTAHREKDDEVEVGTPLKSWDLGAARERELSVYTPIVLIASSTPYPTLHHRVRPGDEVEAGDVLFEAEFDTAPEGTD